jgi:hypothetical protein
MIGGYTEVERIEGIEDLRLYRFEKSDDTVYIAWYGYQELYLPEDETPLKTFSIDVGGKTVSVERMRTSLGSDRESLETDDGVIELELTPDPIYIIVNGGS